MKNSCSLIGRVGKDPELAYTPGQKAVCKFSLATSMGKDKPTEWHNIVVWEALAENCAKFLSKGKLASVEGRIATRKWTDKNGVERYTTEIIANQVLFLSAKSDDGGMTRETVPKAMQFPSKNADVQTFDLDDMEVPF